MRELHCFTIGDAVVTFSESEGAARLRGCTVGSADDVTDPDMIPVDVFVFPAVYLEISTVN